MRKLIGGIVLIVALLWAVGLAQAAPLPLPPRPVDTPTPIPTPTREPGPPAPAAPQGALIILRVTFGDDWSARGLAWQRLWTGVEWRDESGTWHAVEGWQGTLFQVRQGTGWKAWWLERALCGRGPFRWVVYEQRGGPLLARSAPFHLPARAGEAVTVEMSLAR